MGYDALSPGDDGQGGQIGARRGPGGQVGGSSPTDEQRRLMERGHGKHHHSPGIKKHGGGAAHGKHKKGDVVHGQKGDLRQILRDEQIDIDRHKATAQLEQRYLEHVEDDINSPHARTFHTPDDPDGGGAGAGASPFTGPGGAPRIAEKSAYRRDVMEPQAAGDIQNMSMSQRAAMQKIEEAKVGLRPFGEDTGGPRHITAGGQEWKGDGHPPYASGGASKIVVDGAGKVSGDAG